MYANVLKEMALVLKKSGRYEPIFFLANNGITSSMRLDDLQAEQISCLNPTGQLISSLNEPIVAISGTPPVVDNVPDLCLKLKKLVSYPLKLIIQGINKVLLITTPILIFIDRLRYLINLVAMIRQIIQKWDITTLVIGGETQFYDSPASVKAARLEGIPIINAVMFLAPNGGEIPGTLISWQSFSMKRWFNRLVVAIYPHWGGEYEGKHFLYLPGSEALAQEWLGMASPRPPVGESNYSDAVLVECEKMREYAISYGFPQEKLVVTGEAMHDEMAGALKNASQLRDNLYQRLGSKTGKPMLLSGLAPDRISGREARLADWDFQNYAELVQFWVQSMADVKGYNIVITLHPSQKYEDLSYIEQWGVKISRDKTSSLIPLCDIYVADGVSSTIPWAIACGKPVIEYDAFRWRISTYAEAGGVVRVEGKDDFLFALQRLTGEPEYYAEIAARQRAVAKQWGNLDGKAGDRILKLFESLLD